MRPKKKQSSNQKSKAPKTKERKRCRSSIKNEHGRHATYVQQQTEQEKKEIKSPVEKAPVSQVHKCVSESDFRGVMILLQDTNIDAEDKKYEMATYTDASGTNVVQEAIRRGAPYELIELVAFIGGTNAVTKKDSNGYNSMHHVCKRGSSSDIVNALCMVGKEALHQPDDFGELPIHKFTFRNGGSPEVLKTLFHYGDRGMLEHQNHEEMLPVHCSLYFFNTNLEVCKILIREGLHHGVGGEEGLGGLNVEYTDIDRKKKTILQKLKEKKLSNCLLREIKDLRSEKYGTSAVEAGAKHGLNWEKGMEDLIEATDVNKIKLGIVALAASGDKSDLNTIYQLCMRYVGVGLFDKRTPL